MTKAQGVPAQSKIRKTELDKCAEVLSTAIHSSLEQTTQRSKNSGQGEPWWNDNCQKAVKDIWQLQKHQATNDSAGIVDFNAPITLKRAQNQLRKAIKGAKQEYYKKC